MYFKSIGNLKYFFFKVTFSFKIYLNFITNMRMLLELKLWNSSTIFLVQNLLKLYDEQ